MILIFNKDHIEKEVEQKYPGSSLRFVPGQPTIPDIASIFRSSKGWRQDGNFGHIVDSSINDACRTTIRYWLRSILSNTQRIIDLTG